MDEAAPGSAPFSSGGEHAQGRVALHLQLGVEAAHLDADHGVLEERAAVALERLRGLDQAVEGGLVAGHAAQRVAAALVAEGRLGDLPALTEPADQVFRLDGGVGHEDLVELRAAGDLLEGPDLDAGLAHVEEEAGDALVLGHLRVRAGQEDAEVGDVAAGGPDLLAVDQEAAVALVLGARAQAGQVGAGVGLGVELAPDLLGGEDLLEIALLLPVGAVDDDGRADEPDAQAVDGRPARWPAPSRRRRWPCASVPSPGRRAPSASACRHSPRRTSSRCHCLRSSRVFSSCRGTFASSQRRVFFRNSRSSGE